LNNKRASLILIFFIVLVFCSFIFAYNQYKLQWQEKEMERHAIVIEEDYWALDIQGPVKYLTLVSERESYANISIYGLNGEEFLSINGPDLTGLDLVFEDIGLIPQTKMDFDIKHNNETIGHLTADYRNKNIYIYFYVLVFCVLIYFVIFLFLKTIQSKHQLEDRVRMRTIELEEEIDERIKVEAELKDARNYISNIIDSMPSILVGVDSLCRVTQWNKTAEQKTEISAVEAIGQSIDAVLPQMIGRTDYITDSIQSRQIKQDQKISQKSDFNNNYYDITVYPLIADGVEGAVIRVDDVSDKVRLEEMMIQSEKMLSVGGLAAGMAHEINNPLGGMMQTAHVMENRIGKNLNMPANIKAAEEAGTTMEVIKIFMEKRGIPRMINSINDSGKRVAEIIDNMLTFSRKSDGQSTTRSMNELIDKTLELAYSDYDLKKQYDFKLVAIERHFDENLPEIPCERAKIQQVLLNILRNGAQAMQGSQSENPTFTITTRNNVSRKMICIEIKDNGPGMEEATRKRVFEPFFTTKEVGVGTGLGLSVSYFIITENHGGEMEVESHPGDGAKFIIRLPYRYKSK
jgi:signal transduction histidine kinase